MSTLRAILTRVRGVHRHILPTGPCCLVREEAGELTPRRVMDALGETMVVRHPVDRQILHGDQIKAVDDATAVLMGEVAPPPARCAHARAPRLLRRLARSGVPFSSLLRRRCTLASACSSRRKKRGLAISCPVAERGERLQPHINAHLLPGLWQRRWLGALTGEADVPLARAAAADRGRLGRAFQWAMQDDLHQSDAVQCAGACASASSLTADRHLGKVMLS